MSYVYLVPLFLFSQGTSLGTSMVLLPLEGASCITQYFENIAKNTLVIKYPFSKVMHRLIDACLNMFTKGSLCVGLTKKNLQ